MAPLLAVVSSVSSPGITAKDYIFAAIITGCATAIPALLAWHSARKGRKENHSDLGAQNTHLDNKFEGLNLSFQRMDLRFDRVEDTMERHLDWHRVEAEQHLPAMMKESLNVHPNPDANA
jgi:hypothetical protein